MWLLLTISVVARAAGVPWPQAPIALDSGRCRTDVRVQGTGPSSEFAVTETAEGLLIPVQVAARPDTLWLLFDSGAGHTVLDRNVARRLDLRATSQGTISGVGTGATAVDIVPGVALSLPGVRIEHVDLRLASIPGPTHTRRPYADGIIGYDLLCRAVVTLDYRRRRITVTTPTAFRAPLGADVLPLTIRGGWSFVRGTIKVPGQGPVEDEFLLDTGSLDFVNHPIIQKSTGALRQTRTGAGGFGESQAGVIGENEWFRLGRTTIAHTQSACCAASPEVSRQIGAGILSRFRATFDYAHGRLVLENPDAGP
jgi:hypothetical protein